MGNFDYTEINKYLFSVSNNAIETISSLCESHEDVEVRCGGRNWPVSGK